MESIKTIFKTNLTKKNIRKISFLLLPLFVQLIIFKRTNNHIPFVLFGAYFPLLFNCEKKATKYYFMIGLNIFIRFIAIIIGAMFIFIGNDYGTFNITIGTIFIILGITSGNRIPYSLTGILLINSLAYFFLNINYVYFATGFLIFILIEFICGTKLQLLAPFCKHDFSLEYAKVGVPKGIGFTVLTGLLIVTTISIISMTDPFPQSYANQRNIYEGKVERKQQIEKKNNEFIKKLYNIQNEK